MADELEKNARAGAAKFTRAMSKDPLVRASDYLLAFAEAILERCTDGRAEADAATLAEWAEEARAAIAKAEGRTGGAP